MPAGMTPATPAETGRRAADLLAQLAMLSEPGPGVTRLPFTAEHRAAADLLGGLMRQAGLAVRMDAAGTLIGRRDGPPGAPVLILGSHQDSVRAGGAFDGAMGVVLPILALEQLADVALPFAVEVVAFADEEGVRFPTALLGPRALAGTVDPAVLDMTDPGGISLRDALRGFGLDPEALSGARRDPAGVLGYVECHIEQGRVLEAAGEPLGIVTAICGIERHAVALRGEAAHAGTTPMELRRDALAGAADLILAVEAEARARTGLRATVGALSVSPGVVNAVPGAVRLTVEVRAPDDRVRAAGAAAIASAAADIAQRRGLSLDMARTYAQGATPCDAGLSAALADAVRRTGGAGMRLPSGATHDASAMADLCPVAMLFVACRSGISHNPAEHADAADMGRAVGALATFLAALDPAAIG